MTRGGGGVGGGEQRRGGAGIGQGGAVVCEERGMRVAAAELNQNTKSNTDLQVAAAVPLGAEALLARRPVDVAPARGRGLQREQAGSYSCWQLEQAHGSGGRAAQGQRDVGERERRGAVRGDASCGTRPPPGVGTPQWCVARVRPVCMSGQQLTTAGGTRSPSCGSSGQSRARPSRRCSRSRACRAPSAERPAAS